MPDKNNTQSTETEQVSATETAQTINAALEAARTKALAKIEAARQASAANGTQKNPLVTGELVVDMENGRMYVGWNIPDMVECLHRPKPNKEGKIGNSQVVTVNVPPQATPELATFSLGKTRGGNLTITFPLY